MSWKVYTYNIRVYLNAKGNNVLIPDCLCLPELV